MTKKKRHHYIPRFYLKRFSVNNVGKFLGLYNLNNRKFIQNAPLKSQAYENFLYGEDDEIENALSEMESNVSKMFNYWTEEKLLYPPPTETSGFKILKRFILYQIFRTPESGADLMENLNQGLKTILKEIQLDFWEKIRDYTFVHENPVILGLFRSIKHEHLLEFLDCRFLVNLSSIPFVTSDSPVILYNQLMEKADNYMGAISLAAKGLQVFYPIHPRLMICLYDSSVYEFGGGCENCSFTESVEEIHQLNGLQLANCKSQLFFDDLISEEYIGDLCKRFEEYRGTSKNINRIINQGNRTLFLTSSEDIRINLDLQFFKLKVSPIHFKNGLVPFRNHSMRRYRNSRVIDAS